MPHGAHFLSCASLLFDAILTQPSRVIFAVSEYTDSWSAVRLPDHKINLCIDEMLTALATPYHKLPQQDADYPLILSAGECRSDTSNTSIRDAGWHRRGTVGTLRMHPADAEKLGCNEGDWVSLTTRRGTAQAPVELGDDLQPGHVSLNELTDTASRDPFAGTPWHQHVPVCIVRIGRIGHIGHIGHIVHPGAMQDAAASRRPRR
jgi:anaerobic selenocysteine-containing dehydrogenase